MTTLPRRRKSDSNNKHPWPAHIVGWAKATLTFITCSILAFVGNWGIGLNSAIAHVREQVLEVDNKQQFITPWFAEEIKKMHEELREMRKDIKELKR